MTSEQADHALLTDISERLRRLETQGRGNHIWNLAMKAAVPLSIAVAGWVVAIEVRVSVIEASRFTRSDANLMERAMLDRLPGMSQIADIKKSLDKIDARLEQVDTRLHTIEGKVHNR